MKSLLLESEEDRGISFAVSDRKCCNKKFSSDYSTKVHVSEK